MALDLILEERFLESGIVLEVDGQQHVFARGLRAVTSVVDNRGASTLSFIEKRIDRADHGRTS